MSLTIRHIMFNSDISNTVKNNFSIAINHINILICIIASLESARKSAANSNYHTTDEELLG